MDTVRVHMRVRVVLSFRFSFECSSLLSSCGCTKDSLSTDSSSHINNSGPCDSSVPRSVAGFQKQGKASSGRNLWNFLTNWCLLQERKRASEHPPIPFKAKEPKICLLVCTWQHQAVSLSMYISVALRRYVKYLLLLEHWSLVVNTFIFKRVWCGR